MIPVRLFPPRPPRLPAHLNLNSRCLNDVGDTVRCRVHGRQLEKASWGWRCPVAGCARHPERACPLEPGFMRWLRALVTQLNGCKKCGRESGDDWRQCRGACPVPGSPHFDAGAAEHPRPPRVRPPSPLPCGCHCAGGCADPFAPCADPCAGHVPL